MTKREIIGEHFNYTFNFDFIEIVENILERCENKDDIYTTIDDTLIYTKDQWTVMKFYQSPESANLYDALEKLAEDIYDIMNKIEKEEGK